MRFLFFGALLGWTALAGPVIQEAETISTDAIGVTFDIPGDLPILTLPYAKYRANSYDKENDVQIIPST